MGGCVVMLYNVVVTSQASPRFCFRINGKNKKNFNSRYATRLRRAIIVIYLKAGNDS